MEAIAAVSAFASTVAPIFSLVSTVSGLFGGDEGGGGGGGGAVAEATPDKRPAQDRRRKQSLLASQGGRKSTILTGGLGLSDAADQTARPTVLGA